MSSFDSTLPLLAVLAPAMGALFIALVKRRSELLEAAERDGPQRGSLDHYSLPMLDQFIAIVATATLVAVNHWPVAIETHQRNHPTAQHYVEDVTAADPNRIVPGGRLTMLHPGSSLFSIVRIRFRCASSIGRAGRRRHDARMGVEPPCHRAGSS
jgi:hypothetical protein